MSGSFQCPQLTISYPKYVSFAQFTIYGGCLEVIIRGIEPTGFRRRQADAGFVARLHKLCSFWRSQYANSKTILPLFAAAGVVRVSVR